MKIIKGTKLLLPVVGLVASASAFAVTVKCFCGFKNGANEGLTGAVTCNSSHVSTAADAFCGADVAYHNGTLVRLNTTCRDANLVYQPVTSTLIRPAGWTTNTSAFPQGTCFASEYN